MSNVTISVTSSSSYGVFKYGPIYGNERIVDEKEIPGVFELTATSAVELDSKFCGNMPPIDLDDHCAIYGPDISGRCIVKSKTTTKLGGTAGTPYIQETIVYTGVL